MNESALNSWCEGSYWYVSAFLLSISGTVILGSKCNPAFTLLENCPRFYKVPAPYCNPSTQEAEQDHEIYMARLRPCIRLYLKKPKRDINILFDQKRKGLRVMDHELCQDRRMGPD